MHGAIQDYDRESNRVDTSPRRVDSEVSFTLKDKDDKKMNQIKTTKIIQGNLQQH